MDTARPSRLRLLPMQQQLECVREYDATVPSSFSFIDVEVQNEIVQTRSDMLIVPIDNSEQCWNPQFADSKLPLCDASLYRTMMKTAGDLCDNMNADAIAKRSKLYVHSTSLFSP